MFSFDINDRISISSPPVGVGSRGQATGDWVEVHANIPAQVTELSGRELELSRQYVATATHQVVIRWHDNVTEKCKVTWGSRTLGIGAIKNPDNRMNWLILTCEEKKQ